MEKQLTSSNWKLEGVMQFKTKMENIEFKEVEVETAIDELVKGVKESTTKIIFCYSRVYNILVIRLS